MTRSIFLSAFVVAATSAGACRDGRNRNNPPPPPSAMPTDRPAARVTRRPRHRPPPGPERHHRDHAGHDGSGQHDQPERGHDPERHHHPAGSIDSSTTTGTTGTARVSNKTPDSEMPGNRSRTSATRGNTGTTTDDAGINDTGSGSNRDFGR